MSITFGVKKDLSRLIFFALFGVPLIANAQLEKASWISPGFAEDSIIRPCPVFRKIFMTRRKVRSATLFITAHGLCEATLNDRRVGDGYFTPGWTSYDKRLQYQVYDVLPLLKSADNTIEVTVADGWYRGAFGGDMKNNLYGSDASLLLQLDITYRDGSTQTVASDATWQSATGPIRYSNIYNGEFFDARIQASRWKGVITPSFSKDNLVPTIAAPVKVQQEFKPRRILTDLKGEQIIDFGQNISGWVRFTVKGKGGDTIRIYHAEMLDKTGNFYTGNLRQAKATDTYILQGEGAETFEPHFTYHGFRYAKVEGCTANAQDFTAIALHSALEHTGIFSCSDSLINQLQHNIEWSLNDNFFDIPTDCPQRSERLGWTGDAQIFCRTAAFNRNVKNFFTKWLRDLAANQGTNGGLPNIIPDLYTYDRAIKGGIAGWSDAATIVPWTMFEIYDDTALLKEQYSSMKAWVDYVTGQALNYLWKANGYGDWLAPGESTDLPFIDQCFWAYSTQLLVNTTSVLGKTADADHYRALLQKIKKAFLSEYVTPGGRMISNTQTAYVLALQFGMLPDSLQTKAAERLAALIKNNQNHLSTGFLGTSYLLDVLTKYGYTSLAYELLNQQSYPSWLYPVKMGATTTWERWDAVKQDSSVQATSYNHYAYGAVGDWLYQTVAGIRPGSPGYREIIIAPHPGGGLTWAKASYECRFGKIVSGWKIDNGILKMEVTIPPGTTATVYIPGGKTIHTGQGTYRYSIDYSEK